MLESECRIAGVTILVVDTGAIPDYLVGHPWLANVRGEIRQVPFDPVSGLIMEYHGHGTFVSSLARQ